MDKSIKFSILGIVLFVSLCVVPFVTEISEVNSDEYGVYVEKPYIFGSGGVDSQVLTTGRYFHFESTTLVKVPKTPVTVPIPFQDLATADNNLLDFDSSVTYVINDPVAMASLSANWFASSINRQYANIVRRVVMGQSFSDVMSSSKVNQEMDLEITEKLTALVKETKLPITIVDVSLGKATPNKEVLTEMNATAAEQQRQKTLTQRKTSEDLRRESETARAAADSAYQVKMGMSVEQLVDLQKTQLMASACEASNSCLLINGSAPSLLVPAPQHN